MRYKHILVASAVAMLKTIPVNLRDFSSSRTKRFAYAFSIYSDSRFPPNAEAALRPVPVLPALLRRLFACPLLCLTRLGVGCLNRCFGGGSMKGIQCVLHRTLI